MQISLIYGGNIMSEDEKKRVIQEIMSFYPVFQKEILDVFPDDITEISPLLFKALHEIYSSEDITSSTLAKRLSITVPNTSRTLQQLSDLSYIIRDKDENDRRITHIKVTKKGSELIEKSIESMDELMLKKLGVLEVDELVSLSEAFYTITGLLQKIGTINSKTDC